VTVLQALAGEHALAIVLPELALEESVAARRRALEEACRDFIKAGKAVHAYEAIRLPDLPNPDDYSETWRASLTGQFEVAATPDSAGTEALRREAHRLAPARDGQGARDAGIWLTVLAHHSVSGEPGFFVSENVSDFGDPNDPSSFHPGLAAEIPTDRARLVFCRSVAALLSELAEEADFNLDTADVASSELVNEAVASVLQEPPVLPTSDWHPTATVIGAPYIAGPVRSEPIRLFDSKSFSIGESTIAVSSSRWHFEFPLGSLRRHVGGGLAEAITQVSGEANLNLLLRLSPDGSIVGADVMGITAVTIA
jgi:hypothetical protein